jgi:lipopolysaccharide transport system ATP-binding protein
MLETAIRAEHLGKCYRIGTPRTYRTLRETVMEGLTSGLRRVGSLFGSNGYQRPADADLWALKDVSLEIKRGEAVGIIGHNGAGKSTLLKILSRITEPTEGIVHIHGRVGSLLEVGTGFHPELTGRENIYLSGAILGMKRAEIARRFDSIVAFAETERFVDTPVKHYSSGMYLRLAFAVAAHLEPDILIVDEVLAVGDAEFQRKCLGKMRDVSASGSRTVLFVSHNMNAIMRLCSSCVLFERGRIAAAGAPATIVARHLALSPNASAPNSWIDIVARHRTGTGEARFIALQYASDSETAGFQPYPNGPLEFLLAIESDAPRSVASLSVYLNDQFGNKLINADTISLGQMMRFQAGRNEVRLRIEKLHLKPGIYVVGLWLAPAVGTPFDHIESAFELEVRDVSTYGPGVQPISDGVVTCDFAIVPEGYDPICGTAARSDNP